MRHYIRMRKSGLAFIILIVLLLGISLGFYMSDVYKQPRHAITVGVDSFRVEMGVPAVDNFGNGVVGKLITEIVPGSGQVFVNVNVTTLGMTQDSARKAVRAAADYTNTDLSEVDVTFTVVVNATAIDGPSAGAAMASSVILALRNQTPRQDIMMTGTIGEDGSIGRVGSILEKARAAKDAGASIFIVPSGQSTVTETYRSRSCTSDAGKERCRITYHTGDVNIGDLLDITVVEVSDIKEVMDYFDEQPEKL